MLGQERVHVIKGKSQVFFRFFSVCPVPPIFPVCFKLFKSVIKEETRAKIFILGGINIRM